MSSLSQRLLRWPFLCAWRAPSLVLTRSDARLFSFSSRCVFAASAALFAAAVAHWVFFFTVAVAASASCNVCAHAASPRSVSCVIGMVCGGTFFRFAASPKLFVEYLPPLPPGLLRPTFVRDRSPCVSRSYQAFPSPPAAPRALRPLRERAQRAQLQHLRQSSQRACFRTPRRVS